MRLQSHAKLTHMEHLCKVQPMRNICLVAVLFSTLLVVAQNSEATILMSHNKVDGPLGGQHHRRLAGFSERSHLICGGRNNGSRDALPRKLHRTKQMDAVEVTHLAALLGSRAARSLPRKIPSKTRPIDFFWQVSLGIGRGNGSQKIDVENFFPFGTTLGHPYPKTLIELECTVQSIQMKAAKRTQPSAEDSWCKKLLAAQ